jgi:hypothetical protein
MEQTQYLEITSTRRNRKEDPLPASFEVPLSQSGQKLAHNALDPVSIASFDYRWQGHAFNAKDNALNRKEILVQILDDSVSSTLPNKATIGNTTSQTTLIITTYIPGTSTRGALQIIENYYRGAVACVGNATAVSTDRRRIISYTYLGDDTAKIVIESPFSGTITPGTTLLYIIDPTAKTSTNGTGTPYFFLPTGPIIPNAFNKSILFNHTRCQSRPIRNYDPITKLIGIHIDGSNVQTEKEGPINTWSEEDIYSIRRIPPNLCITTLDGDINNNATTFTSFNLSTADANTITNPNTIICSFLEVEQPPESGVLQGGGTLTTTVQLTAGSNADDGYYNGASIRMTDGAAAGEITKIINYDGGTQIATLEPGFTIAVAVGNNYELIFPQEAKRIIKYVDYRVRAIGGSTTTVEFPITTNSNQPNYTNGYYNDLYIRITSGAANGDIRKITNYTVSRDPITGNIISAIVTIDPSGSNFTGAGVVANDTFQITSGLIEGGSGRFTYSIAEQRAYILPFTYDNLYPFVNAYSQFTNSAQWYEIELINLILPNSILDSGFGGFTSFYQYLYVEIHNTRGSGSSSSNDILSNNSSSVRMTFRATIDDIPNQINSTFIKIDGDGMTQVVRFDPQDNLKFAVYLSNSTNPNEREIFKVLDPERFSPNPPNPLIQISAMFSLKKIVLKSDVLAQNAR